MGKFNLIKHDVLFTKGEYKNYKIGDGITKAPEVVKSFWEEEDPDAERHALEELKIHCCGAYFNGDCWNVEEWGIQKVEVDEDGEEIDWKDIELADPRYLVKFDGEEGREVYSAEEARKIAEGHPEAIFEDRRESWLDPCGDISRKKLYYFQKKNKKLLKKKGPFRRSFFIA